MKTKEIVINEEYAVGESSWLRRAIVLEVGSFTKTVYSSSRSFYGHKTEMKGARIQWVGSDGKPYGEPDWVRTQAIKCLWATHAAAELRRHQGDNAIQRKAEELTEALRVATDDKWISAHYTRDRGWSITGMVGSDVVNKLITQLKK